MLEKGEIMEKEILRIASLQMRARKHRMLKFVKWVLSHKDCEVIGKAMRQHDCPIARYYKETKGVSTIFVDMYNIITVDANGCSTARKTKRWQKLFIETVDKVPYLAYKEPSWDEITVEMAIFILEEVLDKLGA